MTTSEQSGTRLVAVEDLGPSQVAVVENTPHGALAVGISAAKPFAVSNRCRHLFAPLGKGHVTDEGCLSARGTLRFTTSLRARWCVVPGRVQASGWRCEGDGWPSIVEDISSRRARRRHLVGRLTDDPLSAALRSAAPSDTGRLLTPSRVCCCGPQTLDRRAARPAIPCCCRTATDFGQVRWSRTASTPAVIRQTMRGGRERPAAGSGVAFVAVTSVRDRGWIRGLCVGVGCDAGAAAVSAPGG